MTLPHHSEAIPATLLEDYDLPGLTPLTIRRADACPTRVLATEAVPAQARDKLSRHPETGRRNEDPAARRKERIAAQTLPPLPDHSVAIPMSAVVLAFGGFMLGFIAAATWGGSPLLVGIGGAVLGAVLGFAAEARLDRRKQAAWREYLELADRHADELIDLEASAQPAEAADRIGRVESELERASRAFFYLTDNGHSVPEVATVAKLAAEAVKAHQQMTLGERREASCREELREILGANADPEDATPEIARVREAAADLESRAAERAQKWQQAMSALDQAVVDVQGRAGTEWSRQAARQFSGFPDDAA